MNAVLMLVRNALELTKRAVGSVVTQDIPVTLYVVDNDSAEETSRWLHNMSDLVKVWHCRPQHGVSKGWNFGLRYLFDVADAEHVLVVNNDVELRQDCYRALIADGGDFVTAVSVGSPEQLAWDGQIRRRPHPDFSCFLVRRRVWDVVGQFDESMPLYASDADYHLRMHKKGIEAYTIGVPFYHYASGTLKSASSEERVEINRQADKDRDRFEQKWKVKVGSEEYYRLFDSTPPPPQESEHVHLWQRRRDGRACALCQEVQIGEFSL